MSAPLAPPSSLPSPSSPDANPDDAAPDDAGAPPAPSSSSPDALSPDAPPPDAPPPDASLLDAPPRALSPRAHLLLGLLLPALVVLIGAVRVWPFTIDDAYISFRYAENLARGHGLVYNPGERVEGYTNFLWTLLLAGAAFLGAPTALAAKILGTLSALAALVPTYFLSQRLRPFTNLPSIATWLLATSFLVTGYAVFGLETPLFLLLTLTGVLLFLREEDAAAAGAPTRFPASGAVFALAALTRPEAPLFLGMMLLWHRDTLFTRRSVLRLLAFALPVAAHLAFRKTYYGAWLPNTLAAKTGDFTQQLRGGSDYLRNYLTHAGPGVWLGIASIASALVRPRRDALALASIAILFTIYVLLVGGDWMPFFRFLAPAEPFAFLLVDDAARTLADRHERSARLSIFTFLTVVACWRLGTLSAAQSAILRNDKTFWDDAAGRTAQWFVDNTEPGPIVIADIGYVGYRTGYPVVDMLGLLLPEVSHLPGGYTRKTGAGYTDIIFGKNPRYFVIIASAPDCKTPTVPSSRATYNDPRFRKNYRLRHPLTLRGGTAWCIYEKTTWP